MFKQDLHTQISICKDRFVVNPIITFFSEFHFGIPMLIDTLGQNGESLLIIGNESKLHLRKFAFTPSRLGR